MRFFLERGFFDIYTFGPNIYNFSGRSNARPNLEWSIQWHFRGRSTGRFFLPLDRPLEFFENGRSNGRFRWSSQCNGRSYEWTPFENYMVIGGHLPKLKWQFLKIKLCIMFQTRLVLFQYFVNFLSIFSVFKAIFDLSKKSPS